MMERSNKNLPLWKKISTGTLYPFPKERSRRIKFQQTIRAEARSLVHVMDQFELLEDGKGEFKVKESEKDQKSVQAEVPPKEEYSVVSSGSGWYNVVSPDGKVMNEKNLRADDASELRDRLEEETDQ